MATKQQKEFIYNYVKAIRDEDIRYSAKSETLKAIDGSLIFICKGDNWCLSTSFDHGEEEWREEVDWRPNCFTVWDVEVYETSKSHLIAYNEQSKPKNRRTDKEIKQILSLTDVVSDIVEELFSELTISNHWGVFYYDMR